MSRSCVRQEQHADHSKMRQALIHAINALPLVLLKVVGPCFSMPFPGRVSRNCLQYCPKRLQYLHGRKMRAIWWTYMQSARKLHAKNTRVKFYMSYHTHLNYT